MAESDRIKWDQRFAQSSEIDLEPPNWLKDVEAWLPRQGHALDIATGAGRLAIWLAGRGFDVLAVDISVAGLKLARAGAAAKGLRIETLSEDLEAKPLPEGPFDVITCFNYRQRDLFPLIQERLKVAVDPARRQLDGVSASSPGCSLTWGLAVKLSVDALAGFTVLSAVGAAPSA